VSIPDERLLGEIKSWLELNQGELVSELEQVVGINSFTTNSAGSNLLITHFEGEFAALGLTSTRIPCHSVGDVIVADSRAVAEEQFFLLSGHVDTVHTPDSPFKELVWQGDKGFGPGILDMKGGVLVALWALKALAKFGILDTIPVRVLLNSDEETGSMESGEILSDCAKGAAAALVFEHGRGGGAVITRRKGVCVLELEAFGRSAHAGNAHQQGRNAILAISRALLEISELTDHGTGTTVSVGKIRGGTTTNTVPDHAVASIDLRFARKAGYQTVMGEIDKICKREWEEGIRLSCVEKVGFPAMIEDQRSRKLAESFVDAAGRVKITRTILNEVTGGGSDASRFSDMGIPSIDGLGPFGADPHTDKEHIELASMHDCILALVSWMLTQRV